MNQIFNLPPGVTLAEIDPPTDTPEDLSERVERLAEKRQEIAADRAYDKSLVRMSD